MSFAGPLQAWPAERVLAQIETATTADVERALSREVCSERELAALLSPRATPLLEALADKAHRRTRRQFGRTIGLYVPLYLSNICGSAVSYTHLTLPTN